MSRVWNGFKPPVFPENDEKTHTARLVYSIIMAILAATLLYVFFAPVMSFSRLMAVILPLFALLVSLLVALRRGRVREVSLALVWGLWLILLYASSMNGGVRAPGYAGFIVVVMIAAFLLGAPFGMMLAVASVLAGLAMILAQERGWLPNSDAPASLVAVLMAQVTYFIVAAALLALATNSIKQALERAVASEERYRLIASVMSDYAFSTQVDSNGELGDQWTSGAFEAITGYTHAEYIQRGGWKSILHLDDREQDRRDMARLRSNQRVISEVRIVRKDGKIRWVRAYAHPKWDPVTDRLVGIYGAVQDITERKKMDDERRRWAEEISLLYRLGTALSGGENLYQALRAFVGELRQVMTVDAFHIGVYDAGSDLFSYPLFLNLDKDLQPPPRKLSEKPGLSWEVISSGKTLYIRDLNDPQVQQNHHIIWVVDAPIRSYLGIPLTLRDRVTGILSVQSLQPDAYTPEQIRLLETIATQVAMTIEKLSLLEQVQQELAERKKAETELQKREAILEIVADAANTFLKTPKWDAAAWRNEVNALLERLATTIQASHAYVFENHSAADGTLLMSLRYEGTSPGFTSDLDNPQYANLSLNEDKMENWYPRIRNGLPFIGDADHASQADMDHLRRRGFQALLDVPIFIDGTWWGTIGFDDMISPRIWSAAEVDALVVAANMLGAAVKRMQLDSTLQDELQQRKTLIRELEKRNAESETLRESAAIVAASLERSETLSRILEQIARVVPYQSVSVQLIVDNRLEIVSSRGMDLTDQEIAMNFPIDEEEPAYPVIQGVRPYILFNDVQVEFPVFNRAPHNNIRAWMAVPLKVKGRVMGIVTLDGERAGQFSERDAELAVTYAHQAAIALENSRLFTELQSELALKQKLINELEDKNAELERFTYTVSHDLRSPLVTIRGFLGYLEREAHAGNMEGFRRDLERISRATLRMDELLKDLLELSRIGRLINKPQDVPFGDLVMDAAEIVRGRLEERGVTLRIQPNMPVVHVDRPRLTEVLQNLLDNAAKYMGNQKAPLVEVGVEGYDAMGQPVFFVRDNGMGIAPEYHDRIFRLFDKLDAQSEGTGVGLALVKRIIEFHGGNIRVESEPGVGTTFYFTLAGGGKR